MARVPLNLDELAPIRRILVDNEVQRFVRDVNFDSESMNTEVDLTTVDATTGIPVGKVTIGVKPQAVSGFLGWKNAVRCIATADADIDGSTSLVDFESDVETGDRVLLVHQTAEEENRIYVAYVDDGVFLTPAEDMNSSTDLVLGMTVQVLEGASAGMWRLQLPTSGTLQYGVTGLVWERIDGGELKDFTPLLPLDRNVEMVHDGDGSASLVLGVDASVTPRVGVSFGIRIPPGALLNNSLANVSPIFNIVGWDSIDVAKPAYLEGRVTSIDPLELVVSVQQQNTDVVAPTVDTAKVFAADPDKLVVEFSKPVYFPSLTGITTPFSVGTARTITAIVSGNGSDTITFDLSGDVAEGDTFDFVVGGSRTAQALAPVLLATGTEPVTLEDFGYTMPGEFARYKGSSVTMSGPDVTSLVDLVGSEDLACTGTPNIVSIGGKDAVHFSSGEYAYKDLAGAADLDNFAVLVVFRLNSDDGSYQAIWSFGQNGALTTTEQTLLIFDGATGGIGRRKSGATGDVTMSGGADTNVHAILFTGDAAGAKVYRDSDTENATSAVTADAVDTGRIVLARMADLSTTLDAFDLDVLELYIGNQKLTGTDITDLFDYVQSEYGV